ncbi:hypothetical protein GCM10018775_45030 [Streptomyces umbrinus]|nr:hypothetical protein GCM10018775_45030 [Streptomyces umbrinus]
MLFQAPVTCGAPVRGREDGCRNNASGLLLGCHIRQHRWQKLKPLIVRRQVREFCSGLFSDGKATVVTLAGWAASCPASSLSFPASSSTERPRASRRGPSS